MFSITNLHAELPAEIDPFTRKLLTDRIRDAIVRGLAEMTHILLVERDDGEGDFLREAAFSPFYNPLSETRFGHPDFEPPWCWSGQIEHWGWEAIHTVGNGGFAFIILVPETKGINPTLLAMLRDFAPCS